MTTYTFDRSYKYGADYLFSNLDPNGEYTDAEYDRLREIYAEKVAEKIASFDPTLIWLPYTSEILCTDETTTTVQEFREWWGEVSFENEWTDACLAVDAERDAAEV